MKKTIFFIASMMTLFVSSCSDMLDVEDKRHLPADNTIGSKTDSLFYALGIMQAMQEAADMYVVQNEMRGDLVTTTPYSSTHLREMANYTATTANKYDSAYVYYKVINNCNNYIARRDTALYNGSYNVTRNEFAAVHSFRAWAYLQLARMYGRVKFFTHPLTSISQIDNDQSPMYGISEIVNALAPEMEKYSGSPVPSTIALACIPIDVMLGEMYLEVGNWPAAASHYYKYLVNDKIKLAKLETAYSRSINTDVTLPIDLRLSSNDTWASSYFGANSNLVSAIVMATNPMQGKTTEICELFGFDQATASVDGTASIISPQIVYSPNYKEMADSSAYYYISSFDNVTPKTCKIGDLRGMSRFTNVRYHGGTNGIEECNIPKVYFSITNPTIVLYRKSTIWLRFAEALNRMGYPDAAFAILKDGLGSHLTKATAPYMTDQALALFASNGQFPFVGEDIEAIFNPSANDHNVGIHGYGCGADGVPGTVSVYQMDSVVSSKMHQLEKELGIPYSIEHVILSNEVPEGSTPMPVAVRPLPDTFNPERGLSDPAVTALTNQIVADVVPENNFLLSSATPGRMINEVHDVVDGEDVIVGYELAVMEIEVYYAPTAEVINAVEDLLCDEYAMELAFEGCRFSDLTRIARHKNNAEIQSYGANFGGKWFSNKIRKNNPLVGKDLTIESNWYLPLR